MFRSKNMKPAVLIPPALFLFAVIALLTFAVRLSAYPYMNRRVTDISNQWQYHTDTDPTPKPIRLPSGTKGIYLNENWYLTCTLPDTGKNASIMFRSDYLRVIAALDEQEIYRFGYEDSPFTTPGKRLILIPLPDGYTGKELKLTLTPTMNLRAYSIYIGDTASLLSNTVGDMLPAFVLGVAVFLLGLTLLCVYFIQFKNEEAVPADFWFGVFVVLVGFFIPAKSFLLLMLLDPINAAVMPMLVSFLIPCAVLLFVRASCERFKIPLLIALAIHTVGYLPTSLMQLFLPNPPTEVLAVFVHLIPVYYTLAVLTFVMEIRAGRKDYRRLTWAGLLLILMILADRINGILGNPLHMKDVEQLTKLGLIFFILVEVVGRVKDRLRSSAQMLANYQTAQVKSRLALEHFDDVKQYMREVYRLNHDIHHHFGVLGYLLDQGNLPRARKYLSKLAGDYPSDKQIIYSKNDLLNYIIGYTVKQAEAKGIHFTHNTGLPQSVGISDNDFYSLFMNMIDNAIEACAAMENIDNRSLELACGMKNGFIHVMCKNSKENDVLIENGKYLSTKSDDTKHGLGIGIIERIVEKYHGVLDIDHGSNCFTIQLVLKTE